MNGVNGRQGSKRGRNDNTSSSDESESEEETQTTGKDSKLIAILRFDEKAHGNIKKNQPYSFNEHVG